MEEQNGRIADVYVAKMPREIGAGRIFPTARAAEIAECQSDKVKRQKYYAWRLLGYALQQTFGYAIERIDMCKSKNGKWTTPHCYFSLSHSENAVAVAVSDRAIGVDVERVNAEKAAFLQTVLTAQEGEEIAVLTDETERVEYLFKRWTQKESFFKRTGDGAFRPSKIAVDGELVTTKKLSIESEEYMLSVAVENAANTRYVLDVDLTE